MSVSLDIRSSSPVSVRRKGTNSTEGCRVSVGKDEDADDDEEDKEEEEDEEGGGNAC